MPPVVYEEFPAALELETLSRAFELSRIRFRLNRKSNLNREKEFEWKMIFECPKPRNYFLLSWGRFEWKII